MSQTIECARCRRRTEPMGKAPYPGPLGDEIGARVCADCWREWQQAEVMVINELRLDFMDPRSQDVLEGQLREFLALDAPPAGDPAES